MQVPEVTQSGTEISNRGEADIESQSESTAEVVLRQEDPGKGTSIGMRGINRQAKWPQS